MGVRGPNARVQACDRRGWGSVCTPRCGVCLLDGASAGGGPMAHTSHGAHRKGTPVLPPVMSMTQAIVAWADHHQRPVSKPINIHTVTDACACHKTSPLPVDLPWSRASLWCRCAFPTDIGPVHWRRVAAGFWGCTPKASRTKESSWAHGWCHHSFKICCLAARTCVHAFLVDECLACHARQQGTWCLHHELSQWRWSRSCVRAAVAGHVRMLLTGVGASTQAPVNGIWVGRSSSSTGASRRCAHTLQAEGWWLRRRLECQNGRETE